MQAAILKRLNKEEKGFTLIELLAVIVILAVIAAIAIPLIGNIINKSKSDSDVATARQIYDASRMYVTSELNNVYPESKSITLGEIQGKGYLDKELLLPSTKNKLDGTKTVITYSDTVGTLTSVTLKDSTDKGDTYLASEVLKGKKESPTPTPGS
ncbi:prepilin-type N-terminal cleavage/methylation domain-containing protein [Cohnella sp. REN36]|uniref:prepilin-type N-terminal cleavage/methylation domain-containing protein n=1 Tax=Cohnella sp. REN36 TaxID=2887347 RepID=UPI001D159DFF|nr:prepilin-type N-terminal cleavage/methylation domain-containing protein [Cohnella sp. REN36]MCC3374613.1 prepilin-type N-terminal cleavage/methylation domain-containing protein [Cohnella sp. REN36]